MKTVMGIDNGTQSTKVVFYDYKNKTVAGSGQAPHDMISENDGTREQKADWYLTALRTACEQVDPALRKTAVAVGVSGQQHGFVPLDAEGNVLYNVKLWCDTATAEECDIITEAYGGKDRLIREAGNPVLPGYTIPKVLWLKRHKPELYAKLAHILLPHDYLNFYLTGEYAMEYGDASGTGVLDVYNRTWKADLIKAVDPDKDLLACLPELREARDLAGHITEETSKELGIPAGIPVSMGGGDNMMGAVGTGAVAPGVITMSLGTSGTLYGFSEKPIVDPRGNLAAFCSSTGGWLPLLCTMNCTVATELMRDLFKMDVRAFDDLAAEAPAGSEGLLTVPFFNGERTPNLPHGKGCLVGMTMNNVKQANIHRSALESAILGMKMGLDSFTTLGFEAKEVRLIGGGANSPLWRQIAADVLNLPVVVPELKEAAAMGGALQALWAMDKSKDMAELAAEHITINEKKTAYPNPETVKVYRGVYEEYNRYVASLTPQFS